MGKYLDIPFPTVENPFDGHIHIHRWRDEKTKESYIHGLEEYRRVCGLKYIALASLPSGNPIPAPRDVSNNIMCAFYKLANKDTYAYGGFIYPSYPANEREMAEGNMSLTTQLDELNEIGFDGVKMLEGKPNLYERVGKALDSDFFDSAFEKMEREGTYILMHTADPERFWKDGTEEEIKKGWFYGDSTRFPTYESLNKQIDNILEKHPQLNLCLAHFFFSSENPERVKGMLEKYKNFNMLHGECVALGCVAAAYISYQKNMLSMEEYYEIRDMFVPFNLPISIEDMDIETVLSYTKSDKKMENNQIKFVLLKKIGKAVIDTSVTDDEVRAALKEILYTDEME